MTQLELVRASLERVAAGQAREPAACSTCAFQGKPPRAAAGDARVEGLARRAGRRVPAAAAPASATPPAPARRVGAPGAGRGPRAGALCTSPAAPRPRRPGRAPPAPVPVRRTLRRRLPSPRAAVIDVAPAPAPVFARPARAAPLAPRRPRPSRWPCPSRRRCPRPRPSRRRLPRPQLRRRRPRRSHAVPPPARAAPLHRPAPAPAPAPPHARPRRGPHRRSLRGDARPALRCATRSRAATSASRWRWRSCPR